MIMRDTKVEKGACTTFDMNTALIEGLFQHSSFKGTDGHADGTNLSSLNVALFQFLCALFEALKCFYLRRVRCRRMGRGGSCPT